MTLGPERPTVLTAGGQNAIGITLGLIGDEWTLLILRYSASGVRRYNEWLERLPISNSVLTGRLARLTEAGLLARVPYQDRPRRHEYVLTKRGRDTWTILLAIWAWELIWVPEHAEQLPTMVHARCGRQFSPALCCGSCGLPAGPGRISAEFGPSGSWERSVPAATTRRRSGPDTADRSGMFPQTVALIGNRWSGALLCAAFFGARRFKDFEQSLGAPPMMITDRLRRFCDLGVLVAGPGAERADWPDYRLTVKGKAFFPVLVCALEWGHRWFRAPEGRSMLYRHRDCGNSFVPRLACDRCAVVLRGREVLIRPAEGPRRG